MAIRDRSTRVCILNREEATSFAATHVLPACNTHPHICRSKADILTSTLLFASEGCKYYEAYYVGTGKKALVFHAGHEWRKVSSQGYWVMQMVPGGAVR